LRIKQYHTPYQETQSENGRVPCRTHWVVKNSSFLVDLDIVGAPGLELEPDQFRARLLDLGLGKVVGSAGIPEEPVTWSCRKGKNNYVVMEFKLNVLSSQYLTGIFHILIETDITGSSLQVTTEGIKSVSKVSQLRKRKASPTQEVPSAKRARCDELLVTLQEFQKIQSAHLQSMQLLLHPRPTIPAALTLEDAFASFLLSCKALSPADRRSRLRNIRSSINDEASNVLIEVLSLLGSDDELSGTPSTEYDGERIYMQWYSDSGLASDSGAHFLGPTCMDSCTDTAEAHTSLVSW